MELKEKIISFFIFRRNYINFYILKKAKQEGG